MDEIQKYVTKLQRKHDKTAGETTLKIEQYKLKHMELSHRVIKIMKKIEVIRNHGYPISGNEEAFSSKLDSLQRQLNQPNQFKGRLNEITALVRVEKYRPPPNMEVLDQDSLESIHNVIFIDLLSIYY